MSVPQAASSRRQAWLSLQHFDFRLLWLGQGVSIVGTQMRIVAVNYQLYHLTGSALALGMVGLCRLVPLVVLGLGSGVAADRLDRRRMMMLTQAAMMLCSALLGWLTWTGRATPALVYTLVTLSAIASTFDLPARQALIPALVPREHLQNALSLNILIWQVATILGPTVGGLVLAQGGTAVVYYIDAASFLAVLLALLLMRYRHVPSTGRNEVPTLRAALEGLDFVRGNPLIWSTMLLDFTAMVFGAASTMLPIFAEQVLHVGAKGLGLLYAAPSVGAVAAATVLAHHSPLRGQGPKVIWAIVAYGFCTVGFGLSTSFPLTLLFLVGTGVADTLSMVVRSTMRQLLTPDELRGRMSAVGMLFFAGGPQLGEVEAGVAAHGIGLGPSVALGGLGCVVATAIIVSRYPQLKAYDQ